MKLLFALIVSALALAAQSHSVTLNWADTLNPAGTTYTVYRASGPCSGSSTFSSLASGIAVKTYLDSGVAVGQYCYQVTATQNTVESDPSNQALAKVKPNAPTQLTLTVQ